MSTTVEQLDALPEGAVVRSGDPGHWTWTKHGDVWTCHELQLSKFSDELLNGAMNFQILWPQPEPDHSMCTRLFGQEKLWNLRHPNGELLHSYTRSEALAKGYGIPNDRTVEERARDAIDELWGDIFPDADSREIVARLAELGLLVRDGEHDD